jgi:hypothetical protein
LIFNGLSPILVVRLEARLDPYQAFYQARHFIRSFAPMNTVERHSGHI